MLVIGGFFCIYFGWKFKQSEGSDRLNDLQQEFGGGSFFNSLINKLWQLIFLVLCVISGGVALVGFAQLDGSPKNGTSKTSEKSSYEFKEQSNSSTVNQQPTVSSQSSKVEENATTEKVYDGDDPIIRQRLGLPPKEEK
jgi:hypothetical protein